MRGKRRRERFCIRSFQQSPSTHTHTYPPLVLMAFFPVLVTSLEIPLFQHHLITYHKHLPPTPSQQRQQQHLYNPPPSLPLLYHLPPPVFLALRTEPNQNVLFCCLGGGSVWCAAHGVFRTASWSVHFPRRGLVHILFFSAFLLGVSCGIAFLHGWMDGRWGGWRDGWGSIADICMALGKVFVFHFMDGCQAWWLGWVLRGYR